MNQPHANEKTTAAGHDAKENKEKASTALKDPSTPPRKAPAARDFLGRFYRCLFALAPRVDYFYFFGF